ncbi:MAG: response regulator [Desulfobacterales bacterium]|nr:response regulator [Desulfobacterales bacterium]
MDKKPLTLLILEDNPDDAELEIKELERKGFVLDWKRVETEKDFKKALTEKPDLILADYKLPSFSGPEALKIQQELHPDIPFIIITGKVGEEQVVECMKAGAIDYVLKDRLSRLAPVVERALKEAEESRERKKTEEKLLNILENSTNLFYSHTPDHLITYVSPQVENILGYTQKEAMGKWTELVSENPLNKIGFNYTVEAIKTGKRQPAYELELIKKNGEKIWTEVRESPVVKEGKTVSIVGALTDITERKLAENSLKESHETFLTVLDSIDATIYVADMETYEILFMNKHMKDKFGADFTGKICWEVFRHESGPCSHCTNDNLLDQEGNPTGVKVWENYNPVVGRWHINYDRAVKWTDGRYVRLQIATDITQLKEMESRLQQAQKMESIGTLAGGIAHDFNNILFPILGHADMLLADIPEDSPFRDSLDKIFTSALRAKELVRQILTFARQESGELMLMKMQPIIKEALRLIRSTISTTIDITQDIKSDCGIIKADPTQIHQIVMNLATNAYHAMEETGGELRVGLKEVELGEHDVISPDLEPGAYACLSVSDTGTGMSKDVIQKVFDPFFTTKEVGKGTGMGLSVVHGIVKGMGGSIHVYSEPEKGTEFKVYFPIEKSSFEKQSIQPEEPVLGGTERILLIDDEEAIITMEKQVLKRLGYQVTSRTSSIEALKAFQANPDRFDLVITDMAMPNMAGDKLSVELIKIRSDIPILLCTGFSENISEEKAASLGIMGFLFKPIVMKDLAQKIRGVLDKDKNLVY